MKGKILFVAGLGVGYVLGAKAGRQRYEQIKVRAGRFWGSPPVQNRVNQAEEFVRDKAPDLAEFLADKAKTVVAKAAGRSGSSGASSARSAWAGARAAASKPAASKPATPEPATPEPTASDAE